MESGNSGSMQSSSGGDEEFESPADSITAAFLANPPSHGGSFTGNFHPTNPLTQSSSSSAAAAAAMFDPLSNLFDPRSSLSNQNPLLNFDMVWSRSLRSDQIPPDLDAANLNSAAADQSLSSISNFSGVHNFSHPSDGVNSFRASDQTELQDIPNNCGRGGGGGGANVVRSSKKRPRASRRAPTTVLTTDTTNFRAMVQEFTGIPAPPFTASSSSPFTRNAARFDLFCGGGSGGGGGGGGGGRSSTHLDVVQSTQQNYLLRPFPQKPPFLSPPSSAFLAGGNLQNPIFDIQNMFQSNPKLIPSSNDQNLKMGIFEEFGLNSHSHSHGLLPTGQTVRGDNNNNSNNNNNNDNNHPPPTSWVIGGSGGDPNQQGVNLRSSNGNLNGKLIRYAAAAGTANSPGFHGDKAAENLRARTEGMVEPWICSSD
ncbi:homeobox protein 5-like [Cucurbita pepo subsp. pepo]|uniref:homeobox protein 5-like n=1 Tax=Cucurbita pepo subsp. pepo TaxID=3664 RepID=UPI000C9D4B1E|nr:homeobox protein 5-like [Cucurbita pepo subsp. pepo]